MDCVIVTVKGWAECVKKLHGQRDLMHQRREGSRQGHLNHVETLASPAVQPAPVIQVTEPGDQHHRSPSGLLRTYRV